MAGRKPLPTQLKLVKGTAPPHRMNPAEHSRSWPHQRRPSTSTKRRPRSSPRWPSCWPGTG